MSDLQSYEVATVDRGYHVYMFVAVWEAAVGQILPCKRKEGNIHDRYAVVVVENNDTSIDNEAVVLNENFHGCWKISAIQYMVHYSATFNIGAILI